MVSLYLSTSEKTYSYVGICYRYTLPTICCGRHYIFYCIYIFKFTNLIIKNYANNQYIHHGGVFLRQNVFDKGALANIRGSSSHVWSAGWLDRRYIRTTMVQT